MRYPHFLCFDIKCAMPKRNPLQKADCCIWCEYFNWNNPMNEVKREGHGGKSILQAWHFRQLDLVANDYVEYWKNVSLGRGCGSTLTWKFVETSKREVERLSLARHVSLVPARRAEWNTCHIEWTKVVEAYIRGNPYADVPLDPMERIANALESLESLGRKHLFLVDVPYCSLLLFLSFCLWLLFCLVSRMSRARAPASGTSGRASAPAVSGRALRAPAFVSPPSEAFSSNRGSARGSALRSDADDDNDVRPDRDCSPMNPTKCLRCVKALHYDETHFQIDQIRFVIFTFSQFYYSKMHNML